VGLVGRWRGCCVRGFGIKAVTMRARFESIKRRYAKVQERMAAFNEMLYERYKIPNPPRGWLRDSENRKKDEIRERESEIEDEFFNLLDQISPRSWRSGISAAWTINNLTYDDAVTEGPLSMLPEPGYGSSESDARLFAEAVR
jgi:hypothetical protein